MKPLLKSKRNALYKKLYAELSNEFPFGLCQRASVAINGNSIRFDTNLALRKLPELELFRLEENGMYWLSINENKSVESFELRKTVLEFCIEMTNY